MDYFDNQQLLRTCFNYEEDRISIPGSKTQIVHQPFQSVIKPQEPANSTLTCSSTAGPADLLMRSFEGNYSFTYPVFQPGTQEPAGGAIILLHGLNERSWHKYLYWAQFLAEQTGKSVILFPMAFHINRSPAYWSDPRVMQEIARKRIEQAPQNNVATPVNAALSTRLETHPEWFVTSGLQSCYDLIELTRDIRSGKHPLFQPAATVDFFAYSVGAFLLEILLIANPDDLFVESRSFLFLGGSSFGQMQGISRFIMDASAFDRLEEVFIRENPEAVRKNISIDRLNSFGSLWNAFLSMLRLDRYSAKREKSFFKLRDQISAIGLADDRVIPARFIKETLQGTAGKTAIPFSTLDFPYPYSHENPFPMGNAAIRQQVDDAFNLVFSRAASFLS